jgi:molecular chaperone GrpE
VTPIEAVGQPFDPHLHEAVAVESCAAGQDGVVLRELRRGYRTAERVVRLAQVVVGRADARQD